MPARDAHLSIGRRGFRNNFCYTLGYADAGTISNGSTCAWAQEEGLLPASQWAMWFYDRLAYHDYEGISVDLDERERLQASIGQHPVLVMRNHGLLATGRNVAEAFHRTRLSG